MGPDERRRSAARAAAAWSKAPTFERNPARAKLTALGKTSPITRLETDDAKNAKAWSEMPELADFEHLGELKPGAEVLLEADFAGRTEPLLVHQRYGLGNAYILATGGTWRWQMLLPHEDQRHEIFWRQLLQAIATSSPQPVTLTSKQVFYGDESTVTLRAEVRDKTFKPAADAKVSLDVTDGLGAQSTLEMTPVAGERGVYQATYETAHPGMFRFAATAARRRSSPLGWRSSRYAARTASPSTTTRNKTARCSSGSRRRPAATTSRSRTSASCPRRSSSPTQARSSAKSSTSGACRSSSSPSCS